IAHLNRARILSDMNKDREARDEFALAARLAPGNPDCYFYWSLGERAQRNFTKETELLRKVVKLQPSNVKAYIKLADSLLHQNRTAEAVAGLRIALAIDPNSAQALYKLSRALHNTDPEESNRLSDQFLRLKAQNSVVDQAKALANEAFHVFTVQNWRESVRLFSEVCHAKCTHEVKYSHIERFQRSRCLTLEFEGPKNVFRRYRGTVCGPSGRRERIPQPSASAPPPCSDTAKNLLRSLEIEVE